MLDRSIGVKPDRIVCLHGLGGVISRQVDGHARSTIHAVADDLLWFERIFSDDEFYRAYMSALSEVTKKAYCETLLAELEPEIAQGLRILSEDYSDLSFDRQVLDENRKFIRSGV